MTVIEVLQIIGGAVFIGVFFGFVIICIACNYYVWTHRYEIFKREGHR